jgi:hypothetical protein
MPTTTADPSRNSIIWRATSEADTYWEVLAGTTASGARWVEALNDGWLVAQWMYSAREAQWFQSRRPRKDDPAIPSEVLALAAERQVRI